MSEIDILWNIFDQFEQHLVIERGLSFKTIEAYMSDLRQFQNYCTQQHLEIKKDGALTPQSLKDYQHQYEQLQHEQLQNKQTQHYQMLAQNFITKLINNKQTVASVKRKACSIIQFYKFNNMNIKLHLPKGRSPLHLVDPQNIIALIKESKNIKTKAFLHLLLTTGCRVSEALSITNNLIAPCLQNQQLHLSILGKGGKERIVFLTPKTISLLNEYKATYPTTKFVFESHTKSHTKKPLTRQWAHKIIKQLCKNLSAKENFTKDNIHPHSFRHAQALLLLESGADLLTIQKILGHRDLKTTQIYLEVNWNDLKKAIEKHPLVDLMK